MKITLSLALWAVIGLIASSHALPAIKRMVYYQQPAAAASWYSAPQRMMYVQYVQPSRTHARSTQAAAALVAGESVATGTYLKDCDHTETDIATAGPVLDIGAGETYHNGEDVFGVASGAHGATSVAEAYPEEEPLQVDVEVPAVSGDDAKVPREYQFETAAEESESAAGQGEVAIEADVAPAVEDLIPVVELPAPAPIAPVATPSKRYLPAKKKVFVELEEASDESVDDDAAEEDDSENAVAAAAQDDEVEEDDDSEVAAVPLVPVAPKKPARTPSARRPVLAKKPVKPVKASPCTSCAKAKNPAPQGTFFPIDFGGTSGGAIAIANSFSTGEGGSATSHAIAYGSPSPSTRTHANPSKRH